MNQMNNILVIDNETGESVVSYMKSGIESSFKYKPDFDELMSLFNDDPEMIYDLDTSKCLLIVDKSGNELSMHEYFKKRHDSIDDIKSLIGNIDFLKITNDILAEHNAEIYIKAGLYDKPDIKRHMTWCDKYDRCSQNTDNLPDYKNMTDTERNNAANRFIGGYVLCQEMMDNYNEKRKNAINQNPLKHIERFDEPKVLTYCNNFEFKNDSYVYKGYLPSLYQMRYIIKYMNIIDFICNYNIPLYMLAGQCAFWTSCEYNFNSCFCASFPYPAKITDIFIRTKIGEAKVFPIFKKIPKKRI